ncbi:outer membrane protein C [Sulfurihydrogenibium azorense Az-Fu1]|uniref:Outer membrane protein C n=1 Tax=Sulfurihydrogenibium azorense (strain DSM 15241 / OCM 825 / Az-Fu1) TaxID=204536 RepID=C1DU31_SULAA|nr:TonB-dependent receptor [Sulfurihydrogenibium azorense]ACN99681.1 outer membrane protein C [Sulfurihydrogenibium azorense Az-Fu1]
MKRLALGVLLSTTAIVYYSQAVEGIRIEKITVEEKAAKEEVASKKELTQEESKITRQIDLGEILSEFYPEIWYMRKAGIANDLYIRGFSKDNINVLIDDSKIYGACPNRMDPPAFHVSSPQIDKVTIKEGPFDVENAGSLAAVVNVKTKDPKEGVGGELGGSYGSWSYRTLYGWGYVGNKFIKVLAGASNQYSKPYESGEGKKVTEYAVYSPNGRYKPQYINDKAFNIDRVWFKTILTPNDNAEIKLSYAFENARNVLYPALKMDALYDRTNRLNGDFVLKDIGLKFSIYYNEVKHDMRDTFRTTSNPFPALGYSMKTYAESKMFGWKLSKDLNLLGVDTTVGIDSYLRNWLANNVQQGGSNVNNGMIPDVNIKDIGLFIKGSKNIDRLTLSAGLRYDYNYSKADPDSMSSSNKNLFTSKNGNKFSNSDNYLSGYVIGKYNFNKKDNVYVGLGHTVRAPDPEERFISLSGMSPWYGNPDLKPTKNTELDLGGEFFPVNNLGIKANLFYSSLKDYIYLYQYRASNTSCVPSSSGNTTCTTYKNIDAAIYGGDINGVYGFTDKVFAELGIAYQVGKKTSKKGLYTDSDLVEIPPLKARAAVKYDDGTFYGLVEGIYSAKQSKVDSDLKEQQTGSWFIMNVKAGYTYANKLFVGVGVDNVFDKFYYNYLSYVRDPFRGISQSGVPVKIPEPGRFIYANVSYRF